MSGADAGAMSVVSDAFLCVIGNLNAVVLYGANSGFAMMNFAWLGMGGGFLTWVAGLSIVLLFLYVGFNVMFKILNVVFNLVFLILFLPLLVASWAFDKTWKIAAGATSGAINMLARTAVRVVGITLEVVIFYGLVSFCMNETMMSDPAAEIAIAQKCEEQAAGADGAIEKTTYLSCFNAGRAANPNAFGYLDRGWDFLVMMLFIFMVYKLLIEDKLRKIIDTNSDGAYFKFGDNVKTFGKTIWNAANSLVKKIPIGK
jgi:hypothetical protein